MSTISSQPNPSAAGVSEDDVAAIDALGEFSRQIRNQLGRVIIGQDKVVEHLLIAIFARGHALLVGVPGLAKTLLVRSLSQTMSLAFSRIQFTPDLMPADITGTDILQESDQPGRRRFEYVKGPIFANIVLADEINRAPPKTQSALLEAMQEHRVTAGGHLYQLPAPFFVLATQNPVEQEGTYPLPEAQLDRFMFLINVDYPTLAEERRIARETTGGASTPIEAVIDGEQLLYFQELVRRVPVPDHIYDMVVALVRGTRPGSEASPAWLRNLVTWGAGPRAVQSLILAAKARAALHGSYLVRAEDIEDLAQPILTHRILTSFSAQSEGMGSRQIIDRLLEDLRSGALA
ncbi:AAA family ATPase [Verrucomicrobia bacterium LW23]|nr:AAA family ATPase [Verrucomicrobia bacterium LW23]